MATITNNAIAAALTGKASTPAGSAMGKGERPQAEIYLNIGLTIQVPNSETGEMEDVFLSLPYGLPVDTMNELVIRGNNAEWNQTAAARNDLLKALVQMGQSLEAGTGKAMANLEVQLYKRNEQKEAHADNNVMAQLLAKLG